MDQLVDEAWAIHRRASDSENPFVVHPSIPILFFGDSTRYFESPVTVVTVGLNPSREEFPAQDRFARFPAAKGVRSMVDHEPGRSDYLAALDAYFRMNPYRNWFGSYEPLLKGMGASYYDGMPNTALHTDLCSPLATDPTWSKLSKAARADLINEGQALWHRLARTLAPDLILISVAREHLAKIAFPRLGEWRDVYTVERQNPFVVRAIDLEIVPEKATTVVFGRCADVPFGTVSHADKELIGRELVKAHRPRRGAPDHFFVQFPHPGGEHNPPTDDMPWNVNDHRRKFLISPGRYLDANGSQEEGELVFWGEWEPPSRVERRWPASGRLPRALHRPYWIVPETSGYRQNTDPWVWGDRMLYSCCKQTVGLENRPTSMQRLTRGSVVCFGSTVDHEFCVDTVLVVASAEPWVPAHAVGLDVDDAFITCTVGSVASSPDAQAEFTLYRGATVDDPVDGMFSFFPARNAQPEPRRFARPPIRLDGLINPASRQSTLGSRRPLAIDEVHSAWRAVVKQVHEADLVLGVSTEIPACEDTGERLPVSARNRC
jgi:hypothetical protein